MVARLAILTLLAGVCSPPCQAVVITQPDVVAQRDVAAWTAGFAAEGDVAPADTLAVQTFSFVMPELAPHRGVAERLFTLPNIGVVLAGLAWMSLVRRRMPGRSGR